MAMFVRDGRPGLKHSFDQTHLTTPAQEKKLHGVQKKAHKSGVNIAKMPYFPVYPSFKF